MPLRQGRLLPPREIRRYRAPSAHGERLRGRQPHGQSPTRKLSRHPHLLAARSDRETVRDKGLAPAMSMFNRTGPQIGPCSPGRGSRRCQGDRRARQAKRPSASAKVQLSWVQDQGYGLLALQAHLPSLHPRHCNSKAEPNSCKEVHGWNATFLYTALYMTAFGDGTMRVCLPSLGADQFDHEDPSESRQQSSFFNWYTFGISFGGFIGLVLVVWLENYKGWDIGFGVCAILILLGLLVVAAGLPFYRNQVPEGSPLTRILQVLVVAFRNRKLELPKPSSSGTGAGSVVAPPQTNNSLGFLDKACIISHGNNNGAWSVCSAKKVEETKAVLRVLPLFVSSIVGYTPDIILFTFTVQQGGLTDTRLGGTRIHVPPATLFVLPTLFQMATLAVYDRLLVPLLRRRTGLATGVTHLQRVGAGFACVALASAVAAVVERKRKVEAERQRMSLFWLAPQFLLLGVSDVTSFTGLLEFFSGEAPRGMKSVAAALFWCALGLASLVATLLVEGVNVVTRRGGRRGGWLEGASLDEGRLDLFYWVVAVVGLAGFVNHVYWARKYAYRHDPRIAEQLVYHDSS